MFFVALVPALEVTAGDGKFAITRCCDDGKLRGIAMAVIVIAVFSYVFSGFL